MPQPFWNRHSTTLDPMLVLAEVEHRIANEFTLAISSINLIAQNYTGDARTALDCATVSLRHYALSHHALLPPLAVDVLDLSTYLREICRALMSAKLADRGIALTLSETPVGIEAWRAWQLGLILSELISNSLRHGAWPSRGGAIRVELTAGDFNIQCCVADNSRDLKPGSIGSGTHILEGLVGELCGHIRRVFYGDGTTVLITLPRFHPDIPASHWPVRSPPRKFRTMRPAHDL